MYFCGIYVKISIFHKTLVKTVKFTKKGLYSLGTYRYLRVFQKLPKVICVPKAGNTLQSHLMGDSGTIGGTILWK